MPNFVVNAAVEVFLARLVIVLVLVEADAGKVLVRAYVGRRVMRIVVVIRLRSRTQLLRVVDCLLPLFRRALEILILPVLQEEDPLKNRFRQMAFLHQHRPYAKGVLRAVRVIPMVYCRCPFLDCGNVIVLLGS